MFQHLSIWQQTLIGFGFKRVEDYPGPKPLHLAQRQLMDAQIELLQAQDQAELAAARVKTLTGKVTRLQSTVNDMHKQHGLWKDSTQHA